MVDPYRINSGYEKGISPQPERAGIPGVCETVGFVAAVGGCGTSTTAKALSRIYSSLFEYKTLYISLDILASKAVLPADTISMRAVMEGRETVYSLLFENPSIAGKLIRDSFGVFCFPKDSFRNSLHFLAEEQLHRLIGILEENFERIVLDIPVNCALSLYAMDICDTLVVCKGWQEERFEAGNELFNYLKTSRDGVMAFAASAGADLDDIYGQFGAEVRGLAETIEGR